MNTQLINLLLLLSYFSCFLVLVPVSAKVFLSIDCGSTSLKPHTDEWSMVWVGDDPYIQTGETHKVNVAVPNISGWDTQVMSTLRAFPTRKKNCYSIDIGSKVEDTTTVERVLVRASFYYGNYDNKSNPPTFHLQFNGNNWGPIGDVISNDGITFAEVVYSLKNGNVINVCVAQTKPNNIPFISALEVRSLDSDVYSYFPSDYPLFFVERFSLGTNASIRFPEDRFDRIWASIGQINPGYVRVRSSSPSLNVSTADKPPVDIFRTAAMPVNTSLKLYHTGISDPSIPVHYNFYFSEVIRLNSTQKRSFNIIVNSKLGNGIIVPENPVIPPYGRALEVHIFNVTSSAATNFSYLIDLVPTIDSTLPPLCNALEGFIVGNKLPQGTNSTDVKALGLLKKSFIQLQDWNGDPCLPSPYTWDWVACSPDMDSPRVTSLKLNGLGLTGILPDFSDMDALETIDLHNNSLMQQIPEFLGMFPKLTELNVADNNFSGTVPLSISNNVNLMFNALGNPNLSCSNTSVCNTESRIPSPNNGSKPGIPSPSNGQLSKTYAQPILAFLIVFSGLLL